jgi:polysaccharide export outer membrane protein
MQRLKKLFHLILIIAALASCNTNPPTAPAPVNTATIAAPDTAVAPVKDTATAPVQNTATVPTPNTTTAPVKDAQETLLHDTYIVQPGDVLTISVWKEKDLQGEVAVRPDGGLNFPLTGEIVAAGKTIDQLKIDIATKLAKYVPDPVVTVMVKNSLGNKIYVIGKVNRPGEFVANRNMDVMQALSMAGGLNPYASENNIKILRRVNGEQKTFRFEYSRVEKGKDLEQNIILQGGDIVVVP